MTSVYVRVRVGAETYAIPVEHVLEASELGHVTAVPGAPATALGVRNLHGQVLPVFDLASLFDLEQDDPPAQLVVAEDHGRRAGLAVGEVTDVGPLSEALQESRSELLVGAALDEGELVGVIDVERLFALLAEDA